MKRIVCLGGGPAGLYTAILFKKALPAARVEVYERNRADDTFGWGVVFSDQTMQGFRAADPETHDAIVAHFYHWDDIDVHFRGVRVRSGGHGFCGIERKTMLQLLQARARQLGVALHFEHEFVSEDDFQDADLIVAADGVHSRVRTRHEAHFEPNIEVRHCRYMWLGTEQTFPAFTFAFEQTEHGWFQIHAYQFSDRLSTVIVETREETWRAHGLDQMDTAQSIAFCEQLFAQYLGGHRLVSNAKHARGSAWLNFNRVLCRRWHRGNLVLIGDAAHTAHFGIGSGTKLAMEDAIALVGEVVGAADVAAGLARYQKSRLVETLKLQNAARNRMEWFENVARYVHLEPWQFAYSLLTGSQRIGHANLKRRDRGFIDRVEAELATQVGLTTPRAPMFLPFHIRNLTLANRVVVSPMAQYRAVDGLVGDWHLVHYGARATGGAGLVYTEMTCVSAEARISPGCTGLWNDAQAQAWRRISDFVHAESPAKIAMQLGHAGRKGSTQVEWEQANHPLPSGNWPLVAPSSLPYYAGISAEPRAMDRADMARVQADFVRSTHLAVDAGFDLLELHMAHGYLLGSFLSPLTNQRVDAYGGDVQSRLRFPLEVLAAVRQAWPVERPLSVRLSATDWAPGGLSEAELLHVAQALVQGGADLLHVSTGQTVPWQQPVYGRMWQTPFSDLIRNTLGVPTITVGNIHEPDQVDSIVAAGRADLCAIARPHLAHAAWTLQAAASAGYVEQWWPDPYRSAKQQLETQAQRLASALPGPV